MGVTLPKLEKIMKDRVLSPEQVALLTEGKASNMTVRRAIKGRGIELVRAKAIAKALHMKVEDLQG